MKPLKAYLNVVKLRANMALGRKALSNYPVVAIIEPTLFCNLRCPICAKVRSGLRPPRAITWGLYKSIIDEIGDYLFELHMYNWGEPLLHKQTPEFIRYAKSKGIDVVLSTNLSMNLSDEYVQDLVRSGLDQLIVSLDGVTEETYERYRRGGNLSLVRANMLRVQSVKRALGVDKPAVTWQFLVFRHNEHEVEKARSIFRSWGADRLSVYAAIVSREWCDEGFEPPTIPEYGPRPDEHPRKMGLRRGLESARPCSWLYGVFVLNPNGRVSPCCAVEDEKCDFAEYAPSLGFFNAWNSERFRRARSLAVKSLGGPRSRAAASSEQPGSGDRPASGSVDAGTPADGDCLVCESCPMPSSCRDFMENRIASTLSNSVVLLLHKRKMQYLVASLLMLLVGGMPLWRSFGKSSALFIQSGLWRTGSSLKRRTLRPT